MTALSTRSEVVFFRTVFRASPAGAAVWWLLIVVRGVVPIVFAVTTGVLIGAVDEGRSLTGPLVLVGVVFVVMQAINPLHVAVSQNLGRVTADDMNDRLMTAAVGPPGLAHLENPDLANELTMARDFDLGITGPPLFISMTFIADGIRMLVRGTAAAIVLFAFTWWAPLVLVGGWGATHWLLRESGVWKDRNTDPVRNAQRHADYAYRLAVDAPAAKEVRLFGLADWVVDRFARRRRELYELQWEATRLREKSVTWSLLVVVVANGLVFWQLAAAAIDGSVGVGSAAVYFQTAMGVSAIAFGGLTWAMDAASAPAVAVERLVAAFGSAETLTSGTGTSRSGTTGPSADTPGGQTPSSPAVGVRFRDVTFRYPTASAPVLRGLDLDVEPGTSLAIVGQNGAGKTTLAKLLCRFYDPQNGAIEVDGRDVRQLDLGEWRSRVAAVFQDFARFELPLRDNVAPRGASDELILAALEEAGATGLTELDTPLAKGYPGGTDLSGGQWQRIALARAICGVKQGAALVLLDEPTAQLDVRGEAEIFGRLLAATRHCTTILVSHRFSTVRLADRIAVVEHGQVVELGSHAELVAAGGRYRDMYELQASRFVEVDEHGEEIVHDQLA